MKLNHPRTIFKCLGLIALIFIIYCYSNDQLGAILFSEPADTGPKDPFAFVFYATQDTYACSALVNIHLLKDVHKTNHRIVVLVSKDVSSKYRSAFKTLGAEVHKEKPLPLHESSSDYYRGCLLKLAAFGMREIVPSLQRVVVLDSDQLILKSLDHLFELPPADLYAPVAYWLDDSFLSSTLMVIQPSEGLWGEIRQTVATLPPQQYDMDIVNSLFGQRAKKLPDSYVVLNTHWEEWNLPAWFQPGEPRDSEPDSGRNASRRDLDRLYVQSHVAHFTAGGKPWSRNMYVVGEFKGHAHPAYLVMWEKWRIGALNFCPPGVVDNL